MNGFRILVVDDDPLVLDAVVELLRTEGHEVATATCTEEAEFRLLEQGFDLVITDLVMPGRSGLELIRTIRSEHPQTPVVLVTGQAHLQTAVAALKAGAIDYMTKPIEPRELRAIVSRTLLSAPVRPASRPQGEEGEAMHSFNGFVSRSPSMRAVLEKLAIASTIDAAVLLRAESGSGKELAARAIHSGSSRSSGPFLAIHLSATPPDRMSQVLFGARSMGSGGRFWQARGGTLLLDEVEALEPRSQLELLEKLNEAPPSTVRVIAATGRDLALLVREGKFREDLYYRLGAFTIELPPLRERLEDIPPLIRTFVERFAARYEKTAPVVTDETLALLCRYAWPGNVRELRNVIEHAVILCTGTRLTPEFLPRMIHRDETAHDSIRIEIGTRMKEVEKTVIARTLDAFGWNKNKTAKVLGISRRSLYNKLERYHIVRAGLEARVPAEGPGELARSEPAFTGIRS